jgi:hypothetical protein
MTHYLISFNEGEMEFPDEDLQDVSDAAHAVVKAAKDARVFVFAGGLFEGDPGSVIAVDGTITAGAVGPSNGNPARITGLTIVDVPTLAEAQEWGARIAVACRCPQQVREFQLDPRL